MQDKTLLQIALLLGIIGVIFLGIFSSKIEITENRLIEDKTVKISGKVTNVRSLDKVTIINIIRQEEIPVIIFENISINNGELIEVTGNVVEYKGEKEIIAEKITIKQ